VSNDPTTRSVVVDEKDTDTGRSTALYFIQCTDADGLATGKDIKLQ